MKLKSILKFVDDLKNTLNTDNPYEIVEIWLTRSFYEELDDYGCYLNCYVGNEVALVSIYKDIKEYWFLILKISKKCNI